VAKPIEQAKKEVVSKDAIPLKTREKKRLADVASEKQRFRPFKDIDPNRVYAKQAPQVSNPLYAALPGSGRIGIGANTTLGTRFGGYMQQVQALIGQKWRTGDVSGDSAPVAIVTFDLLRDGTAKNVRLLQRSGNPSLDFSAQRAILDASPFPPIPPGFDKDSASLEVSFELKR
jgi:protein TonB